MLKANILRWQLCLSIIMLFLYSGLHAQPIYNKKNVTMKLPTYFNGPQDVRVMAYSTDQAGLKKEQRLEMLPEGGLPAIELQVISAANPNKPVHFTDKNGDGNFIDNQPNPFPTAMGAGVLWGIRETTKVFQIHFGWSWMDHVGKPVKARFVETDVSNAAFEYKEDRFNFYGNANQSVPYISIETIAHEFTHGILHYTHSKNNPNNIQSFDYHSIVEALADIFGSFVRHKIEKPAEYNWLYGNAESASGFRNFQNPNSTGQPDTYMGDNWSDPNTPDWDPHLNAGIVNHCFYLLAVGSGGTKENDNDTEYSCVGIGVDTAVKIFWEAMKKLNPNSTFGDLRNATLEAVLNMGHPVGSQLNFAVREAWKAVGLGQEMPLSKLQCETGKFAESVFYGLVPINTAVGSVLSNPQSGEIRVLVDGIQGPPIRTLIFDPIVPMHFIDTNDADDVYTLNNDENLSKRAVSVHFATRLATDYFKTHHNHLGLDGQGKMEIFNMVGYPNSKIPRGYSSFYKFFKYNDHNDSYFSIDQIAAMYFEGIHDVLTNSPLLMQPDAKAIRHGLASIFGLEVNNIFRKSKNQEPIWTFGNDAMGGDKFFMDFSNPKSCFQLQIYNGSNWDSAEWQERAGVINFWYYLISMGTPGPDPLKNESRSAYVFNMPGGLPEKIAFGCIKNLPINPSFEDFAVATELALTQLGYGPTSPEAIANHDALYLVGLKQGPYASTLEFGPVYQKDENNNDVLYGWPVKIRAQVQYPLYEGNRLFEVSKDPDFNENKAQVYRAFQYTSEGGSSLDEKNPGIKTVTAQFYLDEGVYYTRSRLAQVDLAACELKDLHGQLLCRDLEKKTYWTETKAFTLKKVTSKLIAPVANETAQAWHTWFKWQNTLGAAGHELHIADLTDPSIEEDVFFTSNDPTAIEETETSIALGQNKNYKVSMRAKQKEGSPQGVALLWDAAENKFSYVQIGQNGPDIFGEWTETVSFNTDGRKTYIDFDDSDPDDLGGKVVKAPDEGEAVPPFGFEYVLKCHTENNGDGYKYELSDFLAEESDKKSRVYKSLPNVSDGREYTYSYTAFKNPELPFIPEKEYAETATSHFTVDYSLIPVPKPFTPVHEAEFFYDNQASQEIKWVGVGGDAEFEYTVYRTADEIIIPGGIGSTKLQSATIPGALTLPQDVNGGFKWQVRTKGKDGDGNALYGEYSTPYYYWIVPNPVHINDPGNAADPEKLQLSWSAAWAPDGFRIKLVDENGQVIFTKDLKDSQITLVGLMWNFGYKLHVQAINKPAGKLDLILSPDTYVAFHTKDGGINTDQEVKEYDPNANPEQSSSPDYNPEVGFSIAVDDLDHIPGQGFKYTVTVIGSNYFYKEAKCQTANLHDLMFAPFQELTLVCNGNVPETSATYEITVEITDLNGQPVDLFATSIIHFDAYVYDFKEWDKLVNGKPNNAYVPLFSKHEEYILNGRKIGTKAIFHFTYKYIDKF